MTRRDVLSTLAAGGALAATSGLLKADPHPSSDSAQGPAKVPPVLVPKPLPFQAGKLHGISERLITSHHDNNYAGAVKNLNAVRMELARTTKETPGFLVGGLRGKELAYANSMTLHEAYFGNLGGDGKVGGGIAKAITVAWGSLGAWEEAFKAVGMSLAGGSGWAILDYHLPTGELRISWAGDHTQTLASALQLLVMDLYEHAYQMDYGAAAGKYVEAFFTNLDWDEVNRRFDLAIRAATAMNR
ncbi:MAG TPA: Fe-Mn family superoxide dismutase [Holophagaceae bacterium]